MLTRFFRYLARIVAVFAALGIGTVAAGPALAEGIGGMAEASAKEKAPTTQPVQTVAGRAEITTVASALAMEQAAASERLANVDELALAKSARADAVTTDTRSIKIVVKASVGTGQQAASVQVKPKITPVAEVPKPKPAAVEKAPIKTVKEAVKAVAKPMVKVVTSVTAAARVAKMLAFARAQIGEAYVFGGAGPSVWDCSGLTMKALNAAGVTDTGGHGVNVQYNRAKAKGYLVAWSQRKAGDLVFYGTPGNFSHVAISTGGNGIIEAANPARPVIERPYWGTPYKVWVARFIR